MSSVLYILNHWLFPVLGLQATGIKSIVYIVIEYSALEDNTEFGSKDGSSLSDWSKSVSADNADFEASSGICF